MNWIRIVTIVVASGIVTSLTDWLAAGDWIHHRYSYPEIWRTGQEHRAVLLTSPLPFLTSAIFVAVSIRLEVHSLLASLGLATAIWLIAPLPLILTNAAFIKMHRVFVFAQAAGWFVKLAIVAAAATLASG